MSAHYYVKQQLYNKNQIKHSLFFIQFINSFGQLCMINQLTAYTTSRTPHSVTINYII